MSAITANPQGRVDVLLLRVGEQLTRKIEAATGLKLWDGDNGVSGVIEQKVRELNIPDQSVDIAATFSPRSIAEQAGFIKTRRARRVKK